MVNKKIKILIVVIVLILIAIYFIAKSKTLKIDLNEPTIGYDNASITITEFSDFECPFCARYNREVFPIINEEYIKTGKVKYIFRNFPLSIHKNSKEAAEASECANEQGKFWEYHEILFERQSEWGNNLKKLNNYASDLGLDIEKFNACLASKKYRWEVKQDFADGLKLGVSGTPTFFINNIKIVGVQNFDTFKQVIERELNK